MAYEFEQFTAVRLFTSAAYSPDGRSIAYIANTTGEFNLWTMPAGGRFRAAAHRLHRQGRAQFQVVAGFTAHRLYRRPSR